jgi:hypothetical protein
MPDPLRSLGACGFQSARAACDKAGCYARVPADIIGRHNDLRHHRCQQVAELVTKQYHSPMPAEKLVTVL